MGDWTYLPFEKALKKVSYTKKIPKKKFLDKGTYPIVSQEAEFINGYWNQKEDVFHIESPVVIFGDHTKVVKYIDFDFVLGADGVKVLAPIDSLESRFLGYFLENAPIRDLGYARHFKLLKEVKVPLPPIPEQQRIVAILDQAFADIEKARANAEKNLKNARELFDSYLNQVFSQRGEGWVEKPLGELFDVRDGTHDSPSYQESGFPLVTSKNLINGQISLEKVKYISTTDFEKINKRSKVDIGDVLLAMIGTIGNPVIVTQKPSYAIKNVALIKGIPSQNSSFLKYFLESPFTVKKMLAEAKGTTQKFVGLGYLRAFPFYAPSFTEQQHIVASLDKLSMEVQQLEKSYQQRLESLDELKKSLLQKAFSGELTKTEGHAA